MEEYLEFAKNIAFQAGKIMLKYFNQDNGAIISNGLEHNKAVNIIKKYIIEE